MSKYEFIKYLEEGEECKELLEYPNRFITTRGRVWCNKHQKWLKQKLVERSCGENSYYYRTWVGYTHRLVGRYFLPEYKKGLFILHKVETLSYPEINFVENLWVGNNSDNMKDMWRKGRRSKKGCGRKPQYKYNIEGVEYNHTQLIQIGEKHNLSLTGVYSRINNPNFTSWIKIPM